MSSLHRTYSSPNLNKPSPYQLAWADASASNTSSLAADDVYDDEQAFYVVGDRVFVDGFRPGSVAYFGDLEFSSGDWVGVVLDAPTGNHDGRVHGRAYFQCAPRHGLFVRPHRVHRMPDSALGSSASSSRVSTPADLRKWTRTVSALSSSPSPRDSPYYYDEDYRRASNYTVGRRAPTIKSLEQQLNSIKRNQSPPFTRSRSVNERDSVFAFRPSREPLSYGGHQDNTGGRTSVDFSSEPPRVGDQVQVKPDSTRDYTVTGTLRYLGETAFATGEWAGLELDEPLGRNDGSVLGQRYFRCQQHYGLFVPVARIRKLTSSRVVARERPISQHKVYSTVKSPPPNYDAYSSSLFDESDIEREIKNSLTRSPSLSTSSTIRLSTRQCHAPRAKSVQYTFKSSKRDGAPIATRLVQY